MKSNDPVLIISNEQADLNTLMFSNVKANAILKIDQMQDDFVKRPIFEMLRNEIIDELGLKTP